MKQKWQVHCISWLWIMMASCMWFQPDEVLIKGKVVDPNGVVISQGGILLDQRRTNLNGQGIFEFKIKKSDFNAQSILKSEIENYETAFRRLTPMDGKEFNVDLTVWPIDQEITFDMPQGQDPPYTLEYQEGTTKLVLQIPPDSLIFAESGQPVTSGAVELKLTLWESVEDEERFPALLWAVPPGGAPDADPIRLLSSGMMSIKMYQEDQLLQVAPERPLNLTFTVPQHIQALNKTRIGEFFYVPPTLWTLNESTSLWEENTGDSSFDLASGVITAQIRHLSTFNIDEPVTSGAEPGSCIRGRVLNNCGVPIPNARVTGSILRWSDNSPIMQVNNRQLLPIEAVTNSRGEFTMNLNAAGHMHYLLEASAYFAGVERITSHRRYVRDLSRQGLITYNELQSYRGGSEALLDDMARLAPEHLPGIGITCSHTSGICPTQGVIDGVAIDADACNCYRNRGANGCLDQVRAARTARNAGFEDMVGINECWWNPRLRYDCFTPTSDTAPLKIAYMFDNPDPWYQFNNNLCQQCWPVLDLIFQDCATSCTPKTLGESCDTRDITSCCNVASGLQCRTPGQCCLPKQPEDPCDPTEANPCCSDSLGCFDRICFPLR